MNWFKFQQISVLLIVIFSIYIQFNWWTVMTLATIYLVANNLKEIFVWVKSKI